MNDSLKRTPLAAEHEALGAKMVDFGGWYMPVQYSGLMEEHETVRTKVGLFDVSHMGEIRVRGNDAIAFLDSVTTNEVGRLVDGQAQYSVLTSEKGTVIDDLLVYRFSEHHFLLVVNAGTQDKDFDHLQAHVGNFDVSMVNESNDTGQIAIQGPLAVQVMGRLTDVNLDELKYYYFTETNIGGIPTLLSRTGYTGEDGFECYVPADRTAEMWRLLLEEGKPEGIVPAGLGARDTLRLESRMHLYGNDMDETTTVLEAGLGWVTKLKKASDFVGKAALKAQKAEGLTRKLIGFELEGRGIARQGHPVVDEEGNEVGKVTSGTQGPTLKKSIGLAYVPTALSKSGTKIKIQIRKKVVDAVVVKGAFYKRS